MAWGLALSGGGLLGAAHLGVVRALEEWGAWPPATLAGTSAGGIVAGVLAAGATLDDLTAFGGRVSGRPLAYMPPRALRLIAELLPGDPLGPADSLLDSTPFVEGLLALCPGARRVADWRLPTCLTAVDLARGEAVAFLRPGPATVPPRPPARWRLAADAELRTALQATMAMPAVYTPARSEDGAFLVDGGVADLLPVDWAAALGASRVLAVEVGTSPAAAPGRRGILWSLARSFAYAEATLSGLRQEPGTPVLTLRPETAGVPPFGFELYAHLVEAGYAEAVRRREEVLRFIDSP